MSAIPDYSQYAYQQLRHEIDHFDRNYPDATPANRFRFFCTVKRDREAQAPRPFPTRICLPDV